LVANTKKFSVLRVTEDNRGKIDSEIVREFFLTIVLNGQELVTLLCSPKDSQYLAVGYLQSQGLIKSKNDIKKIVIDNPGMVKIDTKKRIETLPKSVLTSSGGRSAGFLNIQKVNADSHMKLSTTQVFSLMDDFEHRSEVFRVTGGVHSAALCDTEGILVFNEDIGRHNAIDKIFGQCLLQDIATDNLCVITSGRVSSEILLKVAQRNVPVFISKNAPTDLGITLANDLGITLVGFVRGTNMNVYTNDWRIVN
jgi:FdhD protein